MTLPGNNLLLRLHKWAWRQDENFLTEAFAHLLQHLLDHEPQAALGIVNKLTEPRLVFLPEEISLLEVRTQIVSSEGTPDLMLCVPEKNWHT